jgi:hypothetical protein
MIFVSGQSPCARGQLLHPDVVECRTAETYSDRAPKLESCNVHALRKGQLT